jgi:hypothetical protein
LSVGELEACKLPPAALDSIVVRGKRDAGVGVWRPRRAGEIVGNVGFANIQENENGTLGWIQFLGNPFKLPA